MENCSARAETSEKRLSPEDWDRTEFTKEWQ